MSLKIPATEVSPLRESIHHRRSLSKTRLTVPPVSVDIVNSNRYTSIIHSCKTRKMRRTHFICLENWIRLIAGSFVLISLALGILVSQYWFIMTAFVGVNLAQSALTGFCPMEILLKKLGVTEKAET